SAGSRGARRSAERSRQWRRPPRTVQRPSPWRRARAPARRRGAGRASCGGAQRVLDQPFVKLGPAAVELAELVSLAQLLGEDPQARYRDTTRRARSPALARAGLGCGFSSSAEI